MGASAQGGKHSGAMSATVRLSATLRAIMPPDATRRALFACVMIGALGVLHARADGEKELLARPGVRIGVTKGSTSERTLPTRFRDAKVVPAENVKIAVEMLNRGELDTYATNKPTLFEMSDAMPGARVPDGNWGLEHMAVAVPKDASKACHSSEASCRRCRATDCSSRFRSKPD
jgi:hypothetical protein